MDPLNDTDDLRRIAPTLFGLPEHHPFVVPNGLFDRFPHDVQACVARTPHPAFKMWLRRATVAVPALALLLFALYTLRPTAPGTATAGLEEELPYASLTDELDTQEILEATDAGEWPEFGQVSVELTPEEALTYVDQHQIDLNEYLY